MIWLVRTVAEMPAEIAVNGHDIRPISITEQLGNVPFIGLTFLRSRKNTCSIFKLTWTRSTKGAQKHKIMEILNIYSYRDVAVSTSIEFSQSKKSMM